MWYLKHIMTIEKNIIEQFDTKYKHASFIGRLLINNFFKTIEKTIPRDVKSVAEIGCGVGFSTLRLKEFFNEDVSFFASDVDPELVEIAQKRNPEIVSHPESIYNLKHPDNKFDLIFCLEVLEHLEDPEKGLKELARITNKYAIISVPREPLWRVLNMARGKYWKEFGNTTGHLNHWSKKSFASFVSKEFNILSIHPSLPWTIILAEKKK